MRQQPLTTEPQETIEAPLSWLFESNPILAWGIVILLLVLLVTIAWYVADHFRRTMAANNESLTADKLNEIEQLKSTAYMTDEERQRLNAASPIANLIQGEIDPELAAFRRIRQQRMSNEKSREEVMFQEIDETSDE